MAKELILPGMNNNHAEFERKQTKPEDDPSVEKANHHLKTAGAATTPFGCEYLGSFAAHIYRDLKEPKNFQIVVQTPIGRAHEVQCDQAHKELKTVLMAKFGRAAPRTRK